MEPLHRFFLFLFDFWKQRPTPNSVGEATKIKKKQKKMILTGKWSYSRGLLIFLSFFSLSLFSKEPPTFKEILFKGEAGDFIVTQQQRHFSLFLISSLSKNTLCLEEITLPQDAIKKMPFDWRKWIEEKAPGNSSWTRYEIDGKEGNLLSTYSISQRSFLTLAEEENLLARLISLPFSSLSDENRKKIGPPPLQDEKDRRSLWNPKKIIDGKYFPHSKFDVFRIEFPKEESEFSEAILDLYFAKGENFPFPYWLELHSHSLTLLFRVIDSGRGLCSPYKLQDLPPALLQEKH